MQTKITERYYLLSVRMAIIKMPTNDKSWRGRREKRIYYTISENVNCRSYYESQCGGSLKNKSRVTI